MAFHLDGSIGGRVSQRLGGLEEKIHWEPYEQRDQCQYGVEIEVLTYACEVERRPGAVVGQVQSFLKVSKVFYVPEAAHMQSRLSDIHDIVQCASKEAAWKRLSGTKMP